MTSRPATRSATCNCGQLRLQCQGDPARLSLCDCRDYHRRTDSAFGIAALYPSATIKVEDESCGGKIYWRTTHKCTRVGVATAALAFPPPDRCAHEQRRHPRVRIEL